MDNQKNQLRQRVWETFTKPTPKTLKTFSRNMDVAPPVDANKVIKYFSVFDERHLQMAKNIWKIFFELADNFQKIEQEAVSDAVSEYQRLHELENPEMVDYAFMVFLTHNERARRVLNGSIPSILKREPQKITPSSGIYFKTVNGTEKKFEYYGGTTSPDENKLSWFREDPLFNEHHEHWHVVYPNGGINNKAKDRAGEMFIYMHQQMMARYDTERIAQGLEKVEPYSDFTKPIPIGYYTSDFTKVLGDIRFSDRKEDWEILSLPYININEQTSFQKNLQRAIDKGYIEVNNKRIKLDANLLGMIVESTGGNVEKFKETKLLYGNVHNMGHMLISNSGTNLPYGVMSSPATNIKDTIFWRWHKSIDNYSFDWQEKQKPNDFADAPNILIRKGFDWSPDIILCDLENISQTSIATNKTPEELGSILFGGEKWDNDFTNSQTSIKTTTDDDFIVKTTSSIKTALNNGIIEVKDSNNTVYKVPYKYLNHQKICYYVRLQNLLPIKSKVTVRVFLVPKEEAENRRMWIELDKFVQEIEGDTKKVAFRKDLDSSVIRKPAVTEPDLENIDYKPLSVDYRAMFSRGLESFIKDLFSLVNVDKDNDGDGRPDEDQVNNPDLLRYNEIYEKAKADLSSGTIDELTFKREKASFKNILTRYLTNISIAWEEMKSIKFPADLLDAKVKVDSSYIVANANQSLDNIEAYYSAVKDFVQLYHNLLEKAVVSMKNELTIAFTKAYGRIYNSSYCECGLPYNLLFPRGTEAGMDFYLMVMVTDWSKDIVGDENCCGSMSYCGAKDEYPDIREMGYPFDRPFNDGIIDTISMQPNMACRTITIKCEDKDGTAS